MSENKADQLLPCPFCGPGQSMVDPWFDDVSKRWAVGCGRCGASTGRSVHAEGSKEAAIKSWNTRALAAPQPAAPLGGREALARMIRKALVENWCDAYDGRQWDEDVLLTGCRKVGGGMGYQKPEEAAQRLALDAADAILAAIPQERGVEREAIIDECVKAAESVEMGRKWSDDPDMQNQGYYTEGEILVEIVDAIRALGKETER